MTPNTRYKEKEFQDDQEQGRERKDDWKIQPGQEDTRKSKRFEEVELGVIHPYKETVPSPKSPQEVGGVQELLVPDRSVILLDSLPPAQRGEEGSSTDSGWPTAADQTLSLTNCFGQILLLSWRARLVSKYSIMIQRPILRPMST